MCIRDRPKGIGYKEEERYEEVMQLYNSAAQAIRNEDPARPILIGAPRSNDPEYLDPYVTENTSPMRVTAVEESMTIQTRGWQSILYSKARRRRQFRHVDRPPPRR